jgi:formate/nitrite transporter FocA (FNT family)
MPTLPAVVKLLGGLVFPVGLTMVVLSGTELYTGNTAVIPMAVYEGKVRACLADRVGVVARECVCPTAKATLI